MIKPIILFLIVYVLPFEVMTQNIKSKEKDDFSIEMSLEGVRSVGHFLTDNDITYWKGMKIPKRKKALVRFVKQIHEKTEERFYRTEGDLAGFHERMLLLYWIKISFESKIERFNNPRVTFSDKIKMWNHTRKSRKLFFDSSIRFKREKGDNFLSQFFTVQYHDSILVQKRFSVLAKRKKIKKEKNMVVIFDKSAGDGSAPKCDAFATDYDNGWVIKWGDEVHSDIAGSRIFAALGFDVDHPYFFGKDELTLVFNEWSSLKDEKQLKDSLNKQYDFDITPFISSSGIIDDEMISENKKLRKFKGKRFVRFIKCSMEARPDRVKRIGSFVPDEFVHVSVLRQSLLAHIFIDNWDTREQNTLLTSVHSGKYRYRLSAVFSDLGTSFGVDRNYLPADFKCGLVNNFGWEAVEKRKGKIVLLGAFNEILLPFSEASYTDLKEMALKISLIDEKCLRHILKKTHWPEPIAELYFHKLASRRKSILDVFEITDSHPIEFNKNLTIIEDGVTVIENGKLIVDYKRNENPESFLKSKGRFRNYGN